MLNRYEIIYREAAFMLKFGEGRDKPAALKIMLEATKNVVNLLGLTSFQDKEDKRERTDQILKGLEDIISVKLLLRLKRLGHLVINAIWQLVELDKKHG